MQTPSAQIAARKDLNIYFDDCSRGWIKELLIAGRLVRVGVFGSYAAALASVQP